MPDDYPILDVSFSGAADDPATRGDDDKSWLWDPGGTTMVLFKPYTSPLAASSKAKTGPRGLPRRWLTSWAFRRLGSIWLTGMAVAA